MRPFHTTGRGRLLPCRAILAAAALLLYASTLRAAGLLIADGGLGGALEVQQHTVEVTLNNGIAVTEITQVFRNTEPRIVEALYTFPVPKGGSVSDFTLWINGKEMTGEVVEKNRARQIYQSYKPMRKDPGLLEQTDYKTFEMRIFPIAAGARQKVRVRYCQELDWDNDWATYVYPLATVTRGGTRGASAGEFSINVQVRSQVPIVSMESPSHGRDFVIARHDDSVYQASLESKGGDLNRDVVLAYRTARPATGLDLITSRDGSEDGYFLLALTAGDELADRRRPADYVFVLDVSGSMDDEGKLSFSRRSVAAFLATLEAQDRLEVITFNVMPQALFGEPTPADAEAQSRVAKFLDSVVARGGTSLRPALTAAYRYKDPLRPLNVVVLSDGMTEQRERGELLDLIRSRPRGTRVFCVGVGNEVNRPLLEQLAEDSGGLATFLSPGDDFERQSRAFRRKLQHPAAENVRIEFAGVEVYDLEPARLPNLYHGSPLRLYGRYRGSGPVRATVRAEIAGQETATATEMDFPARQGANPQIERMWAFARVQRLLKAGGGNPAPPVEDEVVRLGEGYSIVTPYTSFIVLENDAEYQRWQIQRRNALRAKRDDKAQQDVLAQFDAIRAKAAQDVGPRPDDGDMLAGPRPDAPAGPARDAGRPGPGLGGGPVGLLGLGIAGAVAAANWRRRGKPGPCKR